MRLKSLGAPSPTFLPIWTWLSFMLNSKLGHYTMSAFEGSLSRCIDGGFAMEESLSAISHDLPMSVCV